MPDPLTTTVAATALLGGLSGRSQAKAQKQANEQRFHWARRGGNLLAPSTADFQGQFAALRQLSAPMLNSVLAAQALAGQQAAYGAQAGLARAGLGNTGLGASLGAGLQAGAAFQGNQLRSRILLDLLGQTQNIQAQRAGFLAGVPVQPVQGGWLQGAIQGAGSGLMAFGSLNNDDRG